MSVLSGKLSTSSGLGGARTPGPGSSSTYGLSQSQATAYSTGSGIASGVTGKFSDAAGDLHQGKVSMAVIEVLILLLVGFYIWTHAVQGGG